MKYLKKFETSQEKNNWLMSNDYVSPNVVLTGNEVEYNLKPLPKGVSIQHIDGSFHTIEQWTEKGFTDNEANGVAVVDPAASFVIAKTEKYYCVWASDTSNFIEGAAAVASKDDLNDYAGYANTQAMLSVDTSGAAYYCHTYQFPNGAEGYLPSIGEWAIAYKYKDKISEALSLINAKQIGSSHSTFYPMWSSTQYNATRAWAYAWNGGGGASGSMGTEKSNSYMKVRAFTVLKAYA